MLLEDLLAVRKVQEVDYPHLLIEDAVDPLEVKGEVHVVD